MNGGSGEKLHGLLYHAPQLRETKGMPGGINWS